MTTKDNTKTVVEKIANQSNAQFAYRLVSAHFRTTVTVHRPQWFSLQRFRTPGLKRLLTKEIRCPVSADYYRHGHCDTSQREQRSIVETEPWWI